MNNTEVISIENNRISMKDMKDLKITTYMLNDLIKDIERNSVTHNFGFNLQDIFFSFWMLIKVDLFCFLLRAENNRKNDKYGPINFIKYLFNWYHYNIKYNKTDFLFLSLPVANLYSKKGSYNIYHDDFACELSSLGYQAAVLQLPHGGSYQSREINIDNFSLNWIFLKKKWIKIFLSRFKRRNLCYDADVFLEILKAHFLKHLEDDLARDLLEFLSSKLAYYSLTVHYDIAIWKEVISGFRPKFMILPNVCEGGLFGLISLIAKKNNVVVIEAQHAALCPNSFWFNSQAPFESLSYLPDYFWMYGDMWLDVLNLPLKKFIIGNPYYTRKAQKKTQDEKKFDFLLILDAESSENNIKIFQSMSDYSGKIMARPHPFDRHDYKDIPLEFKGIFLDSGRDLWKSVALSKTVIIIGNYFSTVGYEALSIGLPVVFITDTSHEIPVIKELLNYIFIIDIQEEKILLRILEYLSSNNLSEKIESISERLYNPNWRINIKNWALAATTKSVC